MPSYKWNFYKDNSGEHRWKKTSIDNGKIVGASSEGFSSKQKAKENARIMGYKN
ncbi:YegP family protein [Cochleicola gelatinilyticus]|uniref:DUF1508 domain-containing protein n=1 Tax=Cochleicola gelatinilyticus TaxID=1763537 RepID=UPI0009ED05E3|nr:DUF1508 domain-containing protein [Cochleicola gelatinilyticus]